MPVKGGWSGQLQLVLSADFDADGGAATCGQRASRCWMEGVKNVGRGVLGVAVVKEEWVCSSQPTCPGQARCTVPGPPAVNG